MATLFNTLIYQPIYNALVALVAILPGHSIALAVILLTIIVKLILLPSSVSVTNTQKKMKEIAPEIDEIKKQYKDPQEQAMQVMALYKKHNLRPFSNILVLFIQLPVIFALYFVFYKGGLPELNQELLYSFTPVPDEIDTSFFGLFPLFDSGHLILALFAGFTQYLTSLIHVKNMPQQNSASESAENDKSEPEFDFKSQLNKSMQFQFKYVFPIMIAFISYVMSSIIALYFITNNIFTIVQELIISHFRDKNLTNDSKRRNTQPDNITS